MIVPMTRHRVERLGLLVATFSTLWFTAHSVAFADEGKAIAASPASMGLGRAYFFGLAGGIAMFFIILVLSSRTEQKAGKAK